MVEIKLTPQSWIWNRTIADSRWLGGWTSNHPIVWQASLTDDPKVELDLISILSAGERARLARLRQRDDQRRFWVGRGLLRILAGAHLGLAPQCVVFECGQHGKPFVHGRNDFHFNVSHSGEWVLLAFDMAREVGVDVEKVRPESDWQNVAREMFHGRSYDAWRQLGAAERIGAFFRVWTRHEAQSKAGGAGIAAVPLADGRLEWIELALPEGYQGHLCWEK